MSAPWTANLPDRVHDPDQWPDGLEDPGSPPLPAGDRWTCNEYAIVFLAAALSPPAASGVDFDRIEDGLELG